jgi:hypothetical protein
VRPSCACFYLNRLNFTSFRFQPLPRFLLVHLKF